METDLSRVVDALPGFVWTALPDGQIDFLNRRWCEYTGLPAGRSCGRRWQAAVHPEDLSRLLTGWQDVAAGAPVEAEARVRGADGEYRWFQFRAHPSADASGQVVKWCGMSTDIDRRRQSEDAVRARELRFRSIVDGLPVLLSTATPDGKLEQANRHYLEYFGATLAELKACESVHSLHPDDLARMLAVRREGIDAGRPYEIECRRRRADGVYRWFCLRAFPLRDSEGRVTQWYRLQTDIDDQKRAEALLAGEKRLLEMVASGHPMPDTLEALCRLVESTASGSYCSIVLVDPGGTKLQETIAPSLAPEFNDAVRGWPLDRLGGPCVMAARDKTQVIMPDVASDERWRTSWRALAQKHGLRSCWSTPLVSQAGKVLGTFALYQREPGTPGPLQLELIAQFTNIASIAIERAQRDAELRQSEARLADAERDLRQTIDTIPVFVAAYRPDGTRSFVNRTWQEYTGLSLEEATGPSARTFPHFHPADAEALDEAWRTSLTTGRPLLAEARARRADGQYRWNTSHRVPLRDGEGNIVRWYSVGIDIEDRKAAEDALRLSEARLAETERELQLTVDSIPAMVGVLRPDGTLVFVNQTYRDYTGLSMEEATSGSRKDIHPDDAERIRDPWRASLTTGEPFQMDLRLRRSDGAYRWHTLRRVPLRSEKGAILRWYGVASDIEERKAAEDALRRSEARLAKAERELQTTIDTIPTLVATYRPDGSRIFVNQPWLDYTGLSFDSALDVEGATHPDDAARVTPAWQKALAEGVSFKTEMRLRRADGEYRWHSIHRVLARDEAGAIVKWYSVGVDIEEQKRAEQALRESERNSRLIIDSIPGQVAIFGPGGEFEFVNRQILEYFGTTLEDVTSKRRRTRETLHPEDLPRATELFKQSIASGEPFEFEVRGRRFDGVYRWFQSRGLPLRDKNGRVVRWLNLLIDIDERKHAEEALRQSEAELAEAERELRVTLDSIPAIAWRAGPNGYVQQLNKRWFEYTGTTYEEVRGWRWKLCVHPDDLDQLVEIGSKYVASGEPFDSEARLRRFDGEYRWFLFRPAPVRDESGKVVAWYGTITDIEDRKRAEEKAGEAERELQHMLDSIPTMIVRGATNGYIEYLNKPWFEYTGTTLETARGFRWQQSLHPDDKDRLVEFGARFVATAEPADCEARLRRHDGAYRWFLFRPSPSRDEAGKFVGWYGTVTDIEDRKRAEEQAGEAERELQRTIDHIPAMVGTYTADGVRQSVNKWAREYTGVSVEGWTTAFHPDDVESIETQWRECLAKEQPLEREHRVLRADGTYRWLLTRRVPLRDQAGKVIRWYGIAHDIEDRKRAEEELRRSETLLAEGQRISATGTFSWLVDADELTFSAELHSIFEFDPDAVVTLRSLRARTHPEDRALMDEKVSEVRAGRETSDIEIRLRMPDDRIKYLRILGRLVRRHDGGLECLGAIQDVTQRRLSEDALDKVRSELAHVTRVMSLGALTASIAHEVNQPLAGIVTNASTCLRMLAADPPNVEGARETARRTIRDGNRAADVITRLRALFSKKAAAPEIVDLGEAVQEILALVSTDLLRGRIIVRAELGREPLLVTADRVQLQQVILNLVRNAMDAMSAVHDRPRDLLIRTDTEEDEARLIVKDAGVGVEAQTAERLFEAFYTTKSDGMGIGLSVSRSIVESHGGRLWVEPHDGPGATFAFSIPRQATSDADDGTQGAILTRPARGAHDLAGNA